MEMGQSMGICAGRLVFATSGLQLAAVKVCGWAGAVECSPQHTLSTLLWAA